MENSLEVREDVEAGSESGCKYILLIGGVLSGLGKGTIASSIGRLFRSHNFSVTAIKIDPYLNIDAGTMSPFEHGEVFVLNDGTEVDLDLGNYERFLDVQLNRDNNITTGKIYDIVIKKERKGLYLGKTVQVVPHICNEIQDWILRVSRQRLPEMEADPEICLIELGGTVGDIESMPFIEAMRQFQFRVGRSNLCVIHVSLVPVIGTAGEQKTKPTQQSVQQLRALGLSPDIILCRSTKPMNAEARLKISNFCHVSYESVLGLHDVSNLYRIPQLLYDQRIFTLLHRYLNIPMRKAVDFDQWIELADTVDRLSGRSDLVVRVAMVGKYTELEDAYISVCRALKHACYWLKLRVEVDYVEASELESAESASYERYWGLVRGADAIIVPGGFGDRGIEGKVLAARYARESNKPYLGICLGMQVSVIEYARSVLGWEDANSEEFAQNIEHPVIVFMPEISKVQMGGTMRLGKRRTYFRNKRSLIYSLYRRCFGGELDWVDERHRHRYEVNLKFTEALSRGGMDFVGQDETGERQEMVEIPGHKFYVGVQYHPEFLSRPNRPSPLFYGLMMAASNRLGEVWGEAKE